MMPGFIATMKALTAEHGESSGVRGPLGEAGPTETIRLSRPALSAYRVRTSDHSASNHRIAISPSSVCSVATPSRLAASILRADPGGRKDCRHAVQGSTFPRSLPDRLGRIEFTFVTDWSFTSGCSPPSLAETQLPLSVTGWQRKPDRDFHPAVQTPSQTH